MTRASIKKLPNGSWQVRWRDPDTRLQKSKCFPAGKKQQAWDLHDEIEAGRYFEKQKAVTSRLAFGDFAAYWLESYAKVETADSSVVTRKSIIDTHLVPAFGMRPLTDLRKLDLIELRAKIITAGRSRSHANTVASLGRQILEKAVDMEIIEANPWARIKRLKAIERPYNTWTAEERDVFLAYCYERAPEFARAVAFTVHTGLRPGEVAGLVRSAVDFDRRIVTVARIFSSTHGEMRERTKGRTVRYVELNEPAYRAIIDRRLIGPDDRIFPGFLSKYGADKLQRLCKRAGVTEITFHALRHTFGTLMAEAGINPFRLQMIMGHKNIMQTMRYVHMHPEHRGETALLVTKPGKPAAAHKANSQKH